MYINWIPDPWPKSSRTPVLEKNHQDTQNDAKIRNDLSIHLGEHWGIVGITGAGKTHFVIKGLVEYIRMLEPKVPRYIVDSTGDPKLPYMCYKPLVVTGNVAPDLLRDASHTLIWTPDNSKIPDAYSRFFQKLNDSRKPALVVIDEIASMTKQAEDELETLFKQMRKHGGTVVAETQQLAKMNTTFFQQLTHYVQFYINPSVYDLAQSRRYLQIDKEEQKSPTYEHGFFYRKVKSSSPMQEYRDVDHFFRREM